MPYFVEPKDPTLVAPTCLSVTANEMYRRLE